MRAGVQRRGAAVAEVDLRVLHAQPRLTRAVGAKSVAVSDSRHALDKVGRRLRQGLGSEPEPEPELVLQAARQ